ncbi:MAG: glycosyltransferase family 4 protein [Gemmatimonadaceae bacterium]
MRVLCLTHNFPRHAGDPVGSFVLRLAVALGEQGIEVQVVAPSAPEVPASDVIEGIPVTRFRYAPRKLETLAYTGTMSNQVRHFWKARLAMVGFLAAGYRAATRVMARTPVDVMHAHWWFPGGLVARAVRARTGVPYVVTMHGSDIRLARAAGAATVFRSVSGRAAAMTTVSGWLARETRLLDPASAPVVAPMPVVADLFHPGGVRATNRLLFIGKLTEQKGLHHLLRALALMRSGPMVDVVGAGRVDDAHLRVLATELGVAHRVTWHPLLSQAELAALYRAASVHVIPAVDEGLGMTAIESLLSETPVVAFDSGGLPDIVIPDRTGLLVPVGDVTALAAAVDRVLTDGGLRERLGHAGRQFALTRFGPRQVAEQYASILRAAARR